MEDEKTKLLIALEAQAVQEKGTKKDRMDLNNVF